MLFLIYKKRGDSMITINICKKLIRHIIISMIGVIFATTIFQSCDAYGRCGRRSWGFGWGIPYYGYYDPFFSYQPYRYANEIVIRHEAPREKKETSWVAVYKKDESSFIRIETPKKLHSDSIKEYSNNYKNVKDIVFICGRHNDLKEHLSTDRVRRKKLTILYPTQLNNNQEKNTKKDSDDEQFVIKKPQEN